MDRHRTGGGPDAEYRLASESARAVVDHAGPPPAARRFLSTDHLSAEAVAAYVDRRLPATGQARADAHLARCPRCRQEVADQRHARHVLRGSGPIHMPEDLRDRLRSLAERTEPPAAAPHRIEGSVWTRLLRRLRRRGR